MLITIVVILLLIWAAVVGSIYSNFLVFYNNFSESENYHKAYYAAISALERGELVTKQRSPWYKWEWWRKTDDIWSMSDAKPTDFSYLSENESTVHRTINSRTNRIPTEWNWDVEYQLRYFKEKGSNENSENYNMMDYEDAQIFLLYYDKAEGNPYNKVDCPTGCDKSKPSQIEWEIRLPKKLRSAYGDLDTSTSLVAGAHKNDEIVDRQIKWNYWTPFTIFSTESFSSLYNENEADSVFRENDINGPLYFSFSTTHNPKADDKFKPKDGRLTVVGNSEISNKNFSNIFRNSNNVQLKFSLLNLLKWLNSEYNSSNWWDSSRYIYPFLEYYVNFWTEVSDRYFTIDAEWYYGGYKVEKRIWKPTVKESVLSNFTSIFK